MSERNTPSTDALFPRLEAWALPILVAMGLVRALVAALAPLTPDESFYWLWARPVQLSYLDHPGMVGWWIWIGVRLLGNTALGVRLLSVISAATVTFLVWEIGRIGWGRRELGARAALWLNATILFNAAGVLMTPDAPLLLFWSLCVWAIVRLIDDGRARWLYVAAIACGLGIDSKYTMALIVPGAVVTFLLFPALRRWLAHWHFWLAAIIGLCCTAPVVIWNRDHGWASIGKQFGHAFGSATDNPGLSFFNFAVTQIGLVTPLLFLFVLGASAWTLGAGWMRQRAAWFLFGAISLPIILFFAAHAFENVVQAHWSGPAYLGGILAAAGAPWAAGWSRRGWRWLVVAAPVLGLAMTLLVFFQATTALIPVPTITDPTRRLAGWDELAMAVQKAREAHPDAFLFATKHETAGIVAFRLADHPNVILVGGPMRPSFYGADAVANLHGHDGLLISAFKEGDMRYLAPYFDRMTIVAEVPLMWGGRLADQYRIILAQGYHGGLFVAGDGFPGALDNAKK